MSNANHRSWAEALAAFQQGQLDKAEQLCKTITTLDPNKGDAWNLLGAIALRLNRPEEAVMPLLQAIGSTPSNASFQNNLGIAYRGLGKLVEAEDAYRHALLLQPNYPEAWFNLGNLLRDNGNTQAAIESYQQAITQKPDYENALNNQGNLLRILGRFDDAIICYRQALAVRENAQTLSNLAFAHKESGRLDDAVSYLKRAIALQGDNPDLHFNLANTLRDHGDVEQAVVHYRYALILKPDYASAANNLGSVLLGCGEALEALAYYRRAVFIDLANADYLANVSNAEKALKRYAQAVEAIRAAIALKPDCALYHFNLANYLREWQQRNPAGKVTNREIEDAYRRTTELQPDFAEAWCNFGGWYWENQRLPEAESSYRQAWSLKPNSLQYALHANFLLPIIPDSLDDMAGWRRRYQEAIDVLADAPGILDDLSGEVNPLSFFLAYHNISDRPIMEALGCLLRSKVPILSYEAPYLQSWQAPVFPVRRIRVGFLSAFLVGHTIGKLFQGFIRYLDRARFEVVVIHSAETIYDDFGRTLDALADKVLRLSSGLVEQQQALAAEELDVLFFPDIGMAPSSYLLAYARLAPVQVLSWGHPDTTGLETMDYFLSADCIESANADDYYTEKLIRLTRLPCFYEPLMVPTRIPSRSEMGLPMQGTLYGCPQSLFKFHPDFDAILADIVENDATGHIVLLEGKLPGWADLLKTRWAKTFPILLERVVFLPRMPMVRFMALMAHMDVLLDPIHFGSGNTMYEAVVYGTPIVTWPGQFMRGRIVAAAYRQMGIADAPISTRLEDYAPLAVALGRDTERRRNLSRQIRDAAGRELFKDRRSIEELEAFLAAAVEAAGRGELLL